MNSISALRLLIVLSILSPVLRAESPKPQVTQIGGRLELFVDRHLVDKLTKASYRLHSPQRMPKPKRSLPVIYTTVIKDGNIYRGYYRSERLGYKGKRYDGNPGEITCYAESRDGHEWSFPSLDVTKVKGPEGSNVIITGQNTCSHNFAPFLDRRPSAAKSQRFKALGGVKRGGGLFAWASADGIHWRKLQEKPVITSSPFAFDSQNVSFWSTVENRYVCFYRSWQTPHGSLRSISRTTSKDFIHWTPAVATNPNRRGEHLYTSQTHPYFRAPHIFIATPTRFMPHRGSSTDILFMSMRANSRRYARLFSESFIRPGLDPARWGNRSNYVARCVVPTGPAEMSIYHRDGYRYALRTDGFISVHTGVDQGELITKPVVFAGSQLVLNVSSSAAGSMQVELLNKDGSAIKGFRLQDCLPIIGDSIRRFVKWKASNLAKLVGKPVRLRFVSTECDLYSYQFNR